MSGDIKIDRVRLAKLLLLRFNVPISRLDAVAAGIPEKGRTDDGAHEACRADLETLGKYRLTTEGGVRKAVCSLSGEELRMAVIA